MVILFLAGLRVKLGVLGVAGSALAVVKADGCRTEAVVDLWLALSLICTTGV
jgi:hypothetical protein